MSAPRCLYCYQTLDREQVDLHPKCSKRFFGTERAPLFDYTGAEMQQLAQQIVARSIAVTGVQPKLSLQLQKDRSGGNDFRLTIVGLWGSFILKPPSPDYRNLPENEDLTMHLAAHFGIETAEHSLIRFSTGELAYITRRFDRTKKGKLALEDFCQISETLTADKYRGSMEKIGKLLRQLSSRPGLDAITLFE
ncbi:MAG: type II toxin-antitoxin system HipA family toxin, partial [Sphingobacteriales bacterium]